MMKRPNKLTDVKIGSGAVKGYNGDAYPFYVVGVEKGKYSYNKDSVVGLWLVPADSTCKDYYSNDWEVEDYDPSKHTMDKAFYVKATRKNPSRFSEDGTYDAWCYSLCEKPYKMLNPEF